MQWSRMAVGMLGWRRLIPVLLTLSSVVTVDLSPGDLSVSMERTVDISTQVSFSSSGLRCAFLALSLLVNKSVDWP